MNILLKTKTKEILEKLRISNFTIESEKEIPYGYQIKILREKHKFSLNLYYSLKNGFSKVLNTKKENPFKDEICQLLDIPLRKQPPKMQSNKFIHNWNSWIGSDESGKGDFLGPLVVCAFLIEKKNEKYLSQIGVMDSKKILDKNIIEIGEKLMRAFPNKYQVITLNPIKYNELYENFRSQNKKLNELLGWMHGKAISSILENSKVDGILIDKFSKKDVVKSSLLSLKKLKLTHQIKAESDPAVAAASIIARYHFIKKMEQLSIQYNMKFPKGASSKVKKFAQEFKKKYGKEKLTEICKIHFKTYSELK